MNLALVTLRKFFMWISEFSLLSLFTGGSFTDFDEVIYLLSVSIEWFKYFSAQNISL